MLSTVQYNPRRNLHVLHMSGEEEGWGNRPIKQTNAAQHTKRINMTRMNKDAPAASILIPARSLLGVEEKWPL